MQKARDFEVLNLKLDVFVKWLPSRFRVCVAEEAEKLQEPEMVVDAQKITSSRPNRTAIHGSSWRLWQHTQGLHRFESDKILVLRRRGGHRILLPTKKLFAIDTCWERVASMECLWVYQPHSRASLIPRSCWPIQPDFICTFVYVCMHTHTHVFALISYFLSYWCFVCFEGGRRRKRERMNLGGKNLGEIGERERYTWKQLNKNKRKDARSWEKRKQENEVLEKCQLDDMKPILVDSDINIDAKSVRRKLDLSTDPGEWLYFELLQQDPQGDTETGFFLYFHYCSLTRR